MCNSNFQPSSCDWGMGNYYWRMEIADAESEAKEAHEKEMWALFQKYHRNIMPQIHLKAYEYEKEALECGQDDYLENNHDWVTFLKDCMPEMNFGLSGCEDEEAREALLYLLNIEDTYLYCKRINQFAKAYKGL